MDIRLDWEIVEEDSDQTEPTRPVLPAAGPRPRWLRWLIALAAILLLTVAVLAWYTARVYRNQLARVEREVRPVARLEERAVQANDRVSFMALQDTADPAWLAFQEERFGRLERQGWPEFGWAPAGTPQLGNVTIEPGGARLDVTYRFSVTQPLPNGPSVIALRVPRYYRQTPSGWLRSNPGSDYWGKWQHRSGKLFAARYLRPDAEAIVPLIPRMDAMLAKVCEALRCPPQPIFISFDNSPELVARLTDFTNGFDDGSFILYLPSPHMIGLPADAASRDEFYRMVGTRVVQALVVENLGRRTNVSSFPPRLMLQWELAKAGLSGPFITPEMTRTLAGTLQAGAWPSLGALPLRVRTPAAMTGQDVETLSFALAFIEQRFGRGSVEQLVPWMATSITRTTGTLGDAIQAVWKTNPVSLEPARLAFLRKQAGLPPVEPPAPAGELALWCAAESATPSAQSAAPSSIVRVRAAGGTLQTVEGQNISRPTWAPDGKRLAYLQGRQLMVLDAMYQRATPAAPKYSVSSFGWLPDGRLRISLANSGVSSRILNLDAGQDIELAGSGQVWSPDGARMAFIGLAPGTSRSTASQSNVAIWLADADGRDEVEISRGFSPVWSPDSRRIAFLSTASASAGVGASRAGEIRIADVALTPSATALGTTAGEPSGAVPITTLARASDLVQATTGVSWLGNLAWSPDASMLAAALNQSSGATVFILDAGTGAVRAKWRGTSARWLSLAWSADSRYLGFWTVSSASRDATTGVVGTLEAATGKTATLAGLDFDWSPDGKWLAVPQEPAGVLLVAPDLSAMRWLDAPVCSGAAWRPQTP